MRILGERCKHMEQLLQICNPNHQVFSRLTTALSGLTCWVPMAYAVSHPGLGEYWRSLGVYVLSTFVHETAVAMALTSRVPMLYADYQCLFRGYHMENSWNSWNSWNGNRSNYSNSVHIWGGPLHIWGRVLRISSCIPKSLGINGLHKGRLKRRQTKYSLSVLSQYENKRRREDGRKTALVCEDKRREVRNRRRRRR